MIKTLQLEIVTKAIEIIIQTRLDVRKAQFKKFSSIIKELEHPNSKAFGHNIYTFLEEIVSTEQYGVRARLTSKISQLKKPNQIYAKLVFFLVDKKTGEKIEAESWQISLENKGEESKEQFWQIASIFKHLIVFLNKIPLFCIYQKDQELKAKYLLDYAITFERSMGKTLIQLNMIDFFRRECEGFAIEFICLYQPTLDYLKEKIIGGHQLKRKQSMTLSDYDGDRKVSVYTFYDPDLDFTFLSSDDESFKRKGNLTQEIEVECSQAIESDEFEMLLLSQDDEFCDFNKSLFDNFSNLEDQYLL